MISGRDFSCKLSKHNDSKKNNIKDPQKENIYDNWEEALFTALRSIIRAKSQGLCNEFS